MSGQDVSGEMERARAEFLDWPFFEPRHGALFEAAHAWAGPAVAGLGEAADNATLDAQCRALVAALGEAGWLRHCVPASYGGATDALSSRDLCLLRQALAYHHGLADFAFAMQGLGSGAITLAGSEALRRRYLPRVARGEALAAFALSEPGAGSDVAALSLSARADGDSYVLDGAKTWISNGGIADFYCVFARSEPGASGARGISAFVVEAGSPGLEISERLDAMAPHPLATLTFDACRVPAAQRLGAPGEGFKLAMRTLDIFRSSVAAAALGLAERALHEALRHAQQRPMFGGLLSDLQLTQASLGDMATAIESGLLLTYKAAWRRDTSGGRTTRDAAMAKMVATENAQQVIDRAVQLFGGAGVRRGNVVERLYRDIRPLRIYEGATEVQRLIIGRSLLD